LLVVAERERHLAVVAALVVIEHPLELLVAELPLKQN
jgi:hypothetical protein